MAAHSVCDKKSCGECGYIVARTCFELCNQGYGDSDAFASCADLLELRRPGHERDYYFLCTAQLLGAMADNFKAEGYSLESKWST